MKNRYSISQIYLHWIVFLLIILTYTSIELRTLFEKGTLNRTYMVLSHFSFGFLVWSLMIIRLFLLSKNPKPAIIPSPPKFQLYLARFLHILLYIFFITEPTLGLIAKYLKGVEWFIFGISMPVAKIPNHDLPKLIIGIHKTISSIGYWLVIIHAFAALIHHYIFKDNTLLRMSFLKQNSQSKIKVLLNKIRK